MSPEVNFSGLLLSGLFGLLGLCLGSFTTAVIYREAKKQPWYSVSGHKARSFCPHCGTNLKPYELVPLFSWLWLRGKCSNCRTAIPVFYPLIEVLCAGLAVGIYLEWGASLPAGFILADMPFIVALIYLITVYKIVSQRLVMIVCLLSLVALFVSLVETST